MSALLTILFLHMMSCAISSALAPLVSICLASGDSDDSALADDAYMAAGGGSGGSPGVRRVGGVQVWLWRLEICGVQMV